MNFKQPPHPAHLAEEAFEVNFDGIPGPTHNFGGLAYGNIRSMANRLSVSNPRAALFQCLTKMKLVHSLGLLQALLPLHPRPAFEALRRLGYSGSETQILEKVSKENINLLARCYSSSGMWTANAATVSPCADTGDGRTHFTPANLINLFHRYIEPSFTGAILRRIFHDESKFNHHMPLPGSWDYADEGAANHSRFCSSYGAAGIEFFVYGRDDSEEGDSRPAVFPARQTLEASVAIARLHGIEPEKTVFARQNPDAIDAGVFHNDVISVGNKNVFLFHSDAFCNSDSVTAELKRKFSEHCGGNLILVEVSSKRLSLAEAVDSYLFNSQLVSEPEGGAVLVAPSECGEKKRVYELLEEIVSDENPIKKVLFVDVDQSMKNGGGPACLRLRVVLTNEELAVINPGIFFSQQLHEELILWGERHYRDHLSPKDLADPNLLYESRCALDELSGILDLGSIYDFQRP
ncbi:MAG: N-succinylarginine dihydrolase [Desulfomonilaceae bacterium]